MIRFVGYCYSEVFFIFQFLRVGDSFRLMVGLWRGFFRFLRGRFLLEERKFFVVLFSVGEVGDDGGWVFFVGNICIFIERIEIMRFQVLICIVEVCKYCLQRVFNFYYYRFFRSKVKQRKIYVFLVKIFYVRGERSYVINLLLDETSFRYVGIGRQREFSSGSILQIQLLQILASLLIWIFLFIKRYSQF